MTKHWVKWKKVQTLTVAGDVFLSGFPDMLDIRYRGTLLPSIIAMSKKTPISFDGAVVMTQSKYFAAIGQKKYGMTFGEANWFIGHFLEWISNQGYHIELTGDEFEHSAVVDKTS